MKVKVIGQHSVFHFATAVIRLFDVLQQTGVDEIRHGHLYISLYSNGFPVGYLDEGGDILKAVEIDSALHQRTEDLVKIFNRRIF